MNEKVFYPRQNANLQSRFSSLFDVKEFKIQEDFLQISELVNTQNHFMSRSATETDLIKYLPWENQTWLDDALLLTEYLGSLALLSEKFSAFGRSILDMYHGLVFWTRKGIFDTASDSQSLTKAEKKVFGYLVQVITIL